MTEFAADIPAPRFGADQDQTRHGYPALLPATPIRATAEPTFAVPQQPAPAAEADTGDRAGDNAGDSAGEGEPDLLDRVFAPSGGAASQLMDRLRNSAEPTADRSEPTRDRAEPTAERGTTIIADEVVEKITGIACREVSGVYELGGDVSRVFSAVKERIGLGHGDADQGVSVRLDGDSAAIKVVLVVEYGFVVHSVTERVRANVIGAIENMLGLEVTAVDIVVDDIHVPEGGPAGGEPRTAGYQA
jgi:uncharacterized alkaline shock family protein YloU